MLVRTYEQRSLQAYPRILQPTRFILDRIPLDRDVPDWHRREFRHGLLLVRMVVFAYRKLKAV